MKPSLSVFALLLFLTSCSKGVENQIKKDLNSRYTGYEIVEIKKDSSFIYDAHNELNSLRIRVSSNNLNIIKSIADFENGTLHSTGKKISQYIDSVYKDTETSLTAFEGKRFQRSEPCYYVKYRIFKAENKIEKEEYFYIRKYGNNETEIIRRPCDWSEFMIQENYDELIKKALSYYSDILEYRHKYTGTY